MKFIEIEGICHNVDTIYSIGRSAQDGRVDIDIHGRMLNVEGDYDELRRKLGCLRREEVAGEFERQKKIVYEAMGFAAPRDRMAVDLDREVSEIMALVKRAEPHKDLHDRIEARLKLLCQLLR